MWKFFFDYPETGSYFFQDPATPVMEGIIDFHHDLMGMMIWILIFVLWMLLSTVHNFNTFPKKYTYLKVGQIAIDYIYKIFLNHFEKSSWFTRPVTERLAIVRKHFFISFSVYGVMNHFNRRYGEKFWYVLDNYLFTQAERFYVRGEPRFAIIRCFLVHYYFLLEGIPEHEDAVIYGYHPRERKLLDSSSFLFYLVNLVNDIFRYEFYRWTGITARYYCMMMQERLRTEVQHFFRHTPTEFRIRLILYRNIFGFFTGLRLRFTYWLVYANDYYKSMYRSAYLRDNRAISGAAPILHNTPLEIVWTIIPTLLLWTIVTPSFALLYAMDELVAPLITVKAIGRQWYWQYEYSDHNVHYKYESRMLGDAANDWQVESGNLRLLDVDNAMVLPQKIHVRLLVTASDVLHSFAVPSFGVKLDGCPGRLNQTGLFIKRIGVFYGQCSELCGVNHAFMPIVVNVVPLDQYLDWYLTKKPQVVKQYFTNI